MLVRQLLKLRTGGYITNSHSCVAVWATKCVTSAVLDSDECPPISR